MTVIQIFENPEFGVVRTTNYNGEIAFVAKDVAERLDYTKESIADGMTRIIGHVPEEWRMQIDVESDLHSIAVTSRARKTQRMWCLTEQGLYFFLARSDKPKALPFQKWVAGDVIPTIRKTGKYAPQQSWAEKIADVMAYLQAEIQKVTAERDGYKNYAIANQNKIIFAELVKKNGTLCDIGRAANILSNNGVDIGRTRLFDFLRNQWRWLQHNPRTKHLFLQAAIERRVGENVPTGCIKDTNIATYQARLTYKGLWLVMQHFGLTEAQYLAEVEKIENEIREQERLANRSLSVEALPPSTDLPVLTAAVDRCLSSPLTASPTKQIPQ